MIRFTYDEIPRSNDLCSPAKIVGVLADLMNSAFGITPSEFHVLNSRSGLGPSIHRPAHRIMLDCDSRYWCQLAYQFAHEYCHFLIPNNVVQQLRWFEESICALSSIVFLEQLAQVWQIKGVPGYSDYASSIQIYVANNKKVVEPFDLTCLSVPDSPICLKFFSNGGEYCRGMNRYIAIQLLPIFEKYPQLWSAVPNLCKIPGSSNLGEMLFAWRELSSPSVFTGISEVLTLFITHNSS